MPNYASPASSEDLERQARIARARIAHSQGDPERNREARREYAALKLEMAICRAVESAPPLTEAQRARLRTLLSAPPTATVDEEL
jgi:hypothetical protein